MRLTRIELKYHFLYFITLKSIARARFFIFNGEEHIEADLSKIILLRAGYYVESEYKLTRLSYSPFIQRNAEEQKEITQVSLDLLFHKNPELEIALVHAERKMDELNNTISAQNDKLTKQASFIQKLKKELSRV